MPQIRPLQTPATLRTPDSLFVPTRPPPGKRKCPCSHNSPEKVMRNAYRPSLCNVGGTRIYVRGTIEYAVYPHYRFDQLLPVASARKEEHQAEAPHKVSGQKHKPIGPQS